MLNFSFKHSEKHQTIIAERLLNFVSTVGVDLDTFDTDIELQETIRTLDEKYGLADSLYSSLYTQLLTVNHPLSKISNIYKRTEETLIMNTTDVEKDEVYKSELNSNKELYSNGKHSMFASIQYKSYKDNLDLYNAKLKETETDYEVIKLYTIYLYLTTAKGKLFWCISTLYEDINIVDSYNLSSYMGTNPHIIIPLQELIRGDEVIKHGIAYPNDMIPQELKYTGLYEKCKLEFENDVEELRASHRYIGIDLLNECKDWLGNTDTHKLTIENKKNYRLVKPTLLKNKEKTKGAEEDTEKYGNIEIKKHILNGFEARQVFLTPSYKVWKHEKKTIEK